MQKDYIFVAETGITDTTASRIADYAKNAYVGLENEIDNLCLYNTTLESLDGSNVKVLSYGAKSEDISELSEKMERIGMLKSLDAWLREAVKAHQRLIEESKAYSMRKWAEDFSISLPEAPHPALTMTSDDVVAEWDIKKRNRYYSLEAKAATIGKYVHEHGAVDRARKDYFNCLSHPKKQTVLNDQVLIYSYNPSVNKDEVDNLYYSLQQKQAKYQQELNSLKSEIKSRIANNTIDKQKEYNDAYAVYSVKATDITNQYNLYLQEMQKKVNSLKIVIPNDLKEIYDEVAQLGK